jgi:hypothetical protein
MNNASTNYRIIKVKDKDKSRVAAFVKDNWGSSISVSKGKVHDTNELPGFICEQNDAMKGLVTYHMAGTE